MQAICRKFESMEIDYPLEEYLPIEKVLFVDIETTGFTAKKSTCYLIGCAYCKGEEWHSIQWFAHSPEQEIDVIKSFFEFAKDYDYLFHFNGNNFDLPFITEKCAQYSLDYSFDCFEGIDLYKRTVPLKKFLRLANVKLRTIEEFLGIWRDDPFDGGQMLGLYHDFMENPTEYGHDAILYHNRENLESLLNIVPILAYYDMFTEAIEVIKVQTRKYNEIDGRTNKELLMKIDLASPLPRPVSCFCNGCYFTAKDDTGVIKIPVYEGELKYFYINYKDYYYLPQEDTAVHKSIVNAADRENFQQARADNCYTKKISSFLPEWANIVQPVFKKELRDNCYYFEITDDIKRNRRMFKLYAIHLLSLFREG